MVGLIALTILIGSFVGISVILFKKLPVLLELPVAETVRPGLFSKLKKTFKKFNRFGYFSVEAVLQKVLSLLLKIEKKVNLWQAKLRQRMIQRKRELADDYWKKLKISAGALALSAKKHVVGRGRKTSPKLKTETKKRRPGKKKQESEVMPG